VEGEQAKKTVSRVSADGDREGRATRDLQLDLDAFAWQALDGEADKMGMSIEELVSFSVLYYLADRDSGRIARSLPSAGSSARAEPNTSRSPLEKLLGG
jgi:macrodomain Ter protein organizer (MatP/YcbG family)